RGRPTATENQTSSTCGVAGPHPRPPCWLYRLGDLRSEPETPWAEYPSPTASQWRRRGGRGSTPARNRRLWTLRTAACRALHGPILGAGVSLRRQEHRE